MLSDKVKKLIADKIGYIEFEGSCKDCKFSDDEIEPDDKTTFCFVDETLRFRVNKKDGRCKKFEKKDKELIEVKEDKKVEINKLISLVEKLKSKLESKVESETKSKIDEIKSNLDSKNESNVESKIELDVENVEKEDESQKEDKKDKVKEDESNEDSGKTKEEFAREFVKKRKKKVKPVISNGNDLRKYRLSLGYSQNKMGSLIGVSGAMIGLVERSGNITDTVSWGLKKYLRKNHKSS